MGLKLNFGNILKGAANVAKFIPGVGNTISAGLNLVGGLIPVKSSGGGSQSTPNMQNNTVIPPKPKWYEKPLAFIKKHWYVPLIAVPVLIYAVYHFFFKKKSTNKFKKY